jgi:hypothetical protein
MEQIDIALPAPHNPTTLVALIEHAARASGLLVSRRALRSYPGSIHWHLKRPGARGTLELTYWPRTGRLWFAIHANRRADWIAAAVAELIARIVQDYTRLEKED